jgi:hypothetical protein
VTRSRVQTWEYVRIQAPAFRGDFVVLGAGQKASRPGTLEDILNELGEDGWEVTAVLAHPPISVILKRPRR